MISQTIAGYEVLEELGAGGMGVVYKARHSRLGRHVALKLLPPEHLADADRGRRFLKEARAASALNHPGIVTIHDVVSHEGADVIVMELVEGEPLDRRIPPGGLPWREAAELALGLAEAMAAAHDAGIVHRDLKPANVMVTPGGRVKVLDFGIAKLMPDPGLSGATVSELTEFGTRPGTPAYMAPEQLLGEPVDPRADIFAFGILVFEMLTGQRPFRGQNPVALVDEILHADPPGVRELRPDVPTALAELTERALAKQPAKRYPNMGEVAAELRSILGPELAAEPDEGTTQSVTLEVAASPRAGKRLAVGLAAAVLLLLSVSLFAYLTLEARNREVEVREAADERRRQAEKVIAFLLGDLRRDLESIGRLDLLDEAGDQVAEYFSAVPEADLGDAEVRAYARALHQVGQVRLALGNFPEARAAFGRSQALAEGLAARDPARADWRFDLGQSHFWLGFLHFEQRDLEAALVEFEAYRRISQELVARDPGHAEWQLELAYSHSNVASVLEQRGELTRAAAELEVSARVLEQLVAGRSGHPLAVELAHVYAKLGKVLKDHGELAGALARYQAHLDLMRRASAAAPDDVELLRFLGLAHSHVGDALWWRGDLAGALGHFRADLEIAGRVAGGDRENPARQEELALVHNKVARAHLLAGDVERARHHLEEERLIVQALVESAPEPGRWRFAQAIHRLWQSELLVRDGRAGAAVPELEACGDAFEVLARETQSGSYGRLLARTLWLLGEAHDRAGDASSAHRVWREAAELSDRLLAEGRALPLLDVRVRLLLSLERPEEARPLVEELAAVGYREPSYLDFLERRRSPAAAASAR